MTVDFVNYMFSLATFGLCFVLTGSKVYNSLWEKKVICNKVLIMGLMLSFDR